MRTHYIDLKEGNRLRITSSRGIEAVLDIDILNPDGSMKVHNHNHYMSFKRNVEVGDNLPVCKYVVIYNFGNRGYGKRAHVRIQLLNGREYKKE
ncbi:hypothetical protein HYV50_05060 [Candidatus Pacearchaeota archaeon]|nr:hypothetical protein [Candidatus Pacearchaeota archaeon]